MARVEITFFTAGNRSQEGGSMPVPRMEGLLTEVLTSGASSVATTTSSLAPDLFGFVRVTSDGAIWVVAGESPTAAVPAPGNTLPGLRVAAGAPADLAVRRGDRIALING